MLSKHCQRHNGPEGWVHLTKVTSWGHITNSSTNLDQISSWESRPSINVKFSTKHEPLDKTLSSKSQFTISTKIQLWFNITFTKHQQQKTDQTPASNLAWASTSNLDQTLCSKSEQKFSFLTKPQVSNLQQIVANTIIISNSYSINKFWVGIFTRQGHINRVY